MVLKLATFNTLVLWLHTCCSFLWLSYLLITFEHIGLLHVTLVSGELNSELFMGHPTRPWWPYSINKQYNEPFSKSTGSPSCDKRGLTKVHFTLSYLISLFVKQIIFVRSGFPTCALRSFLLFFNFVIVNFSCLFFQNNLAMVRLI